MKALEENDKVKFLCFVILGIVLRFSLIPFGYNTDFDAYCVVGEISGHFRNVYAETNRYNYGPIFFCVQGTLYNIASIFGDNWIIIYRILMVATLTLTDFAIMIFIFYRYDNKMALLFFLNPISIFITGYHNQFDNIAILFAILSTCFYNDEEKFNKKDIGFIAMLSLSLITKHIIFLVPIIILLKKDLPFKKKITYAFVPPSLFLLSFVPFVIGNEAAYYGVMHNVFLYRSFNNMPIFYSLFKIIKIPNNNYFIFYLILMMGFLLFTRSCSFEKTLYLYLIAMVAFASAVANQYLAIPMIAVCILVKNNIKYVYMVVGIVFLILSKDGLNMIEAVRCAVGEGFIMQQFIRFDSHGYELLTWILVISLIFAISNLKNEK